MATLYLMDHARGQIEARLLLPDCPVSDIYLGCYSWWPELEHAIRGTEDQVWLMVKVTLFLLLLEASED